MMDRDFDYATYWVSIYDDDSSMVAGLSEEDYDGVTLVDEEEGNDCDDMAQHLRRFNIGEDNQTVEEVEDWATRVMRAIEASQQM